MLFVDESIEKTEELHGSHIIAELKVDGREPGSTSKEEKNKTSLTRSEGVVSSYFKEMRDISLLNFEEEQELGRCIKECQATLFKFCLNNKTSYVPLRAVQKKLRQWRGRKKPSNEPIELIFQEIKKTVQDIQALDCPEPELVSFAEEYNRLEKRLNTAMGEMVKANLRLAVNIAKRYARRGVSLPDLIQEGNLGLLKAAARYDYTTGYRFSTYASWWIHQTISRALSDQGRTIRVPVHFLEARKAFYRTYFSLVSELGREPNLTELSERSGLSMEKILHITQVGRETVSLETPISDDGDLLRDLIENKASVSPLDAAQGNELLNLTQTALETLDPRERKILTMRFGLDNEGISTLEKVGQVLNISRERVRQLEKRALKRLRQSPQRNKLKNYLAG
ncbi:MAG: sigma-70 family RNA polymerase sigma factor [Deltaproteobacteria bacterium]|nr:sigma-70 family RNA polymerase sigma factor [Deltaproteobacteria bacterium]